MLIGEVIGSYHIHRLIGRGGFGVVYAAEHQLLGRPAAIKVLRPAYSEDEAIVRRFFNEARAITQIRHPGIVEVYDFGYHEGQAYLAMELLDGESLAARITRDRTLPVQLAVAIARETARVLIAAHKAGVIHRDLKPENVFLVPDIEARFGLRVKLLDFGVAKLATPKPSSTATGSVLGTPLYMSPEQCRSAGRVDARSDLYSLGCILYEMLCGKPPFVAEGIGDLLIAHMQDSAAPARTHNRGVSPALEGVLARTLAKSPGDRPQSAEALVAELDEAAASPTLVRPPGLSDATTQERRPARRGPRVGLALGALLAVAAGGSVWLLTRPQTPIPVTLPAPPLPVAPAPPAPRFVVERPRLVRLAIDSRPAGATVLREDGSSAGVTPLALELPERAATHRFIVRLAGRGEREVMLAGDRDDSALVEMLAPAAERPRRAPRPAPDDNATVDPFAEKPRR